MPQTEQLLTIKEASRWASDFLNKSISESNISYLVQYGKVKKHNGGNFVRSKTNISKVKIKLCPI